MGPLSHSKVLVGMSGGVDSSVAAALLCEQGFEVSGLSIALVRCHGVAGQRCCSAADRRDAAAVCSRLGIPHEVREGCVAFRDEVIAPFVEEYLRGRTPSPCIRCNGRVKFPELLAAADECRIDRIATGHYARVVREGSIVRLLRGADPAKDQSYFLFTLSQEILARLELPLGGLTKDEVRGCAAARALPTQAKPESQETCFVPDDDCARFVEEQAGARLAGPGNFVDPEGRVLGRHRGIHAYTVGQRRGLGIATGERCYVVALDPVRNEVVLGRDEDLLCRTFVAAEVAWVDPGHAGAREAVVKIRSTHEGTPAALEPLSDRRVRVRFSEPVRAVAPGQAAVFYRDDEVLGGGWIEA